MLSPWVIADRARILEAIEEEKREKVAKETARRMAETPTRDLAEVEGKLRKEMRAQERSNTLGSIGVTLITSAALWPVAGPFAPYLGGLLGRTYKMATDTWIELPKNL